MDFDLVIHNGTVIDGTGRPRFHADVGIRAGILAAVSSGERLEGRRSIDASNMIVAPGFVDIHSHADWILPLPDHDEILAPLLLQGVTTLVTGNCGFSPAPVTEKAIPAVDGFSETMRERDFPYEWRSFKEFLSAIKQVKPLLNAAFLVGHGTLRSVVMGNQAGPPSSSELVALRNMVKESIQQGAFGLSAGLAYAPGVFAKNEELLELLKVVAQQGAIFTVHGRAYSWVSPFYTPMFFGTPHNVRSERELISLARQAGVRLQLSHQIFVGRRTWRTHRTVLQDIEQAANDGLDVAFDAFPYTVGNSLVNVIFPEWFLNGFKEKINDPASLKKLRNEINLLKLALGIDFKDIRLLVAYHPDLVELEGLDFENIAQKLKMDKFEAYIHVARLSAGQARILLGTYSGDWQNERPLQAALSHPLCSFMTDTILTRQSAHNPASFGSFPRVLGHFCRDQGLFSLEEAIHRMTSFSADRIGLKGIGRIAEGLPADLVVFNPQTVADNTTPEVSDAPPSGIEAVLISGQIVVQKGELNHSIRCGRVLYN
ncbi:MAG: amidohydrolase family protein [Anaerolineales bacterium]|jgi:N-acyl-D-amino-acid deacylase